MKDILSDKSEYDKYVEKRMREQKNREINKQKEQLGINAENATQQFRKDTRGKI